MDTLLQCYWAESEEYRSTRYFWQNRNRAGEPVAVVQWTLSGEAFFEERGQYFRVPKGHAMLFCHGDESSYGYPADAKEPYQLMFMSFVGVTAIEVINRVKARRGPVVPLPEESETSRLLRECYRRYTRREFQDTFQESALVYTLLMTLCREMLMAPQSRDALTFAEDYMATRYQLPITIAEVAEAAGLSREHFSRCYRERFGHSPGQRLLSLRMEAARKLLATTQASIEAVARSCGYRDADSFSRAFKRGSRQSPAVFRSRGRMRSDKHHEAPGPWVNFQSKE